ncbi:hypothetical protein [Promicromonospora sp. MEB111]|uniref:hypothetical protein n=1 Tax=Promicromonospora sp. MEB111 TaxID=3040301 RepID=UPI00254F5020|nr:hypothetical protein [Promicromonospora sp. MEB111]
MRRTAAASIAAGALAAALLATTLLAGASASAAPGDPASGWSGPEGEVHRDVAVSGSGRVFSVSLPGPGTQDESWLEHGRLLDWSRVDVPASSQGGVIAGPGDYAMAVTGSVSWLFDGTGWDGPVTVAAQEVARSKLVGNKDGDAALLWSAAGGRAYLSRLERGSSWVTRRVPSVLVDAPRDVAINDAGKVTVVWAAPKGTTAEIRRTVIQPGATTWSPSVALGTVDHPRPRLRLVTEGGGRETLLARDKLWRQASSTTMPTYQFRTSNRAELAAGDSLTRLVWAGMTGDEHRFYTRSAGTSWGPRTLMWANDGPGDCPESPWFGVGMVPSGRSYVAVAVRTDVGETTEVCGGPFAAFVTLDRFDGILNTSHGVDTALPTTPYQIVGGTGGPIVLEYEPGNWTVDWRMQFYDR